MAAASPITISPPPSAARVRGDHWLNNAGTKFQNPWPSFKDAASPLTLFKFLRGMSALHANDPDREKIASLVPQVKPNFGGNADQHKMKATWLGHAAFLVEMPNGTDTSPAAATTSTNRGVTVLFDPAFSDRPSPFQNYGASTRYQPLPFTVADLPEVDVIVISHNHYDHQDNNTLTELYKKHAVRPPILFVPLNNLRGLPSQVPKDKVVELDWWEDRVVTVEGKGSVKVTCTPSQHNSSRYGYDAGWSLWSSWAVESLSPTGPGSKVWHGGDTGYCSVPSEETDHQPHNLPHCPAFKMIGDRLGPFSVGFIPIGAYGPRWFLSPVHATPSEALKIFKDTRCKTALGMHWGTWRMAWEPIAESQHKLVTARGETDVSEAQFGVCAVGETRTFDA